MALERVGDERLGQLAGLGRRDHPPHHVAGEDVDGNAASLDLLFATIDAYERRSGRRLAIERVMAWNVLTVLGDALWRAEAGVALPGGGDAAGWVDDLWDRLGIIGVG